MARNGHDSPAPRGAGRLGADGAPSMPDVAEAPAAAVFTPYRDPGRHGLLRRLFTTWRHVTALAIGGLADRLRTLPQRERRRPGTLLARGVLALLGLPVKRALRREPFARQLRLRLELLGPTYIKLGQMLSLREDLLPAEITGELTFLLDRLPAVPYAEFVAIVRRELGRPVEDVFRAIDEVPLASGSIGQAHLATTQSGERVVLKAVKPGVREALRRDATILRGLGAFLELFLGRYQPRRVIADFCEGTRREADLALEAANAEMFRAAFKDQPRIVFPRILPEYSTGGLLCMQYLDGIKPTDPRVKARPVEDREQLVDLGAEAIVCMLYRDGFFHADLHPGNVLILDGPRCGFVDLARVGCFDARLRRILLFYFHALINGDAEGAANFLTGIAERGPGADPVAFRRDVEMICQNWPDRMKNGRASLARLIMDSIARAAAHRMYFPLEMVLMVRAILTFEAVGRLLVADFDVAAISRRHVRRLFLDRFGPLKVLHDTVTGAPEVIDALARTPRLVTEAVEFMEQTARRPPDNPIAGVRSALLGGACLISGAILAGLGGPWPAWAALIVVGLIVALRR